LRGSIHSTEGKVSSTKKTKQLQIIGSCCFWGLSLSHLRPDLTENCLLYTSCAMKQHSFSCVALESSW